MPGSLVASYLTRPPTGPTSAERLALTAKNVPGKAPAGSVTEVARAGIAVAVRQGAPKPDISSPDALTRTLLAAKSISYVDPASGGASGIHFAKVDQRAHLCKNLRFE
jgi:molybdate transport system substrate-binding protein